jgi:hypothetical protein
MFSHAAVSNVLNNILNNNTFVNLCSNNLFNLSLSKIDSYNITKTSNHPFIGIISDDPIGFSQKANDLYLQYHVPGLLFFHSSAPSALKKEDKYILSQKLSNTTKVFFSEKIKYSWGLSDNNSHTIQYAANINESNKNKNVILLNSTNNSTINNIYEHIKNKVNDVDILTKFIDYDDCVKLIGNYKIAVCLENFYDVLFCCASECRVITNISNNFTSAIVINDYNSIIPTITKLLNINNNDDINQTVSYIKSTYQFDTFLHSIKLILSNFQNRAYIHEA